MQNINSITIDECNFRYCSEGVGPDALVIGSALYYPRSFSQNLRKYLRLHFVDYRGFAEPPACGFSDEPSFDTLIEDIEKIRKELSLNTCIIIGHSAHALLALEYAKKYSQHVSHVVMIATSPNFSFEHANLAKANWEEAVWPERKKAYDEMLKKLPDEKLSKLPPDQAFVQWNVRRAAQSWFDYNFDSSSLWHGVSPNMPILDFFYRKALSTIDITNGLNTFTSPVLLAMGRFDYILAPISCWDPLRPKFHNLTVKIFERSGHSPQQEEADLFDTELLNWLQSFLEEL